MIIASNIALVITALTLTHIASAAFVDTGGIGSGGSSGSSGGTGTTDTLELVMTVIKNEKPEVSGDLFGGVSSTNLSLKLIDSPAGNYGYLDISAEGAFRYAIKNDLPQVQALGLYEVAEEVFHYQFTNANGITTNAKLTVYILGNPSVSYDNVEIEFNNITAKASPIHAGSSSQQGQYMRGQLTTASDRDWFVFNSLGNEIINLELCPEGSQCVDEKAWVMYVFDADALKSQADEFETFTLRRYIQETNETLSTSKADHLYLLHNKGIFNKSLIGVIDPCFGDRRTLDIGVGSTAKTYYVAISSPLLRENANGSTDGSTCGSGDVVRKEVIPIVEGGVPKTLIQEYLTAFPYSDDQYTFKVTRTGADPFAVIQPINTTFDSIGKIASIPQMRVNDQLFSVNLKQLKTSNTDTSIAFEIQSFELLNESLVSDPYLPTYNPANKIVKIPQVVVSDTGKAYTVELLYQPLDNTLLLLRAEPLN